MFDRHIREQAGRQPHATALVRPDRTISFAAFDHDVDRAAALCGALDTQPGEAVAVAVSDPYLQLVATLALARLGMAWAPGDDPIWRLRITDQPEPGASLVLSPAALEAVASPGVASGRPAPDPEAIGRVAVSSGTTGRRKRMGLSWRALDARIANAATHYAASGGPWLSGTGIGTTFGFNIVAAAWACGHAVALSHNGALDIDFFFEVRPRLVSLIPAQLKVLLDRLPPDLPRRPLRIVVGAGTVPPPLAGRTRAALTDDLLCIYGAAESGGVTLTTLDQLERTPALAGHATPGSRIEIVDDTDGPVSPDTLGHVRIASDRLVSGYIDDAGQLGPLLQGGWFYPGDLGRLDAASALFIEGRRDDLMNIAGHKVLPLWIEQAALTCPGIMDAGAFGRRNADGLESCCLAVVSKGPPDAHALSAALTQALRWLPGIELMQLDAIPRNAMGKIERPRLRAAADQILATRAT